MWLALVGLVTALVLLIGASSDVAALSRVPDREAAPPPSGPAGEPVQTGSGPPCNYPVAGRLDADVTIYPRTIPQGQQVIVYAYRIPPGAQVCLNFYTLVTMFAPEPLLGRAFVVRMYRLMPDGSLFHVRARTWDILPEPNVTYFSGSGFFGLAFGPGEYLGITICGSFCATPGGEVKT